MTISKKTGKIVRSKTLGQKIKANATRKSNKIKGSKSPVKRRKKK